jgi:hypothetical protein
MKEIPKSLKWAGRLQGWKFLLIIEITLRDHENN